MPELWETWIQSPSQGDPLEEVIATYSSILAWEIPWTEEPMGVAKSWMQLSISTDERKNYEGQNSKKTEFNSKI